MRNSTTMVLATAGVLALGLAGCASSTEGAGAGASEESTPQASATAAVELTEASFVTEMTAAQQDAGTVRMTTTYSGAGAEVSGLDGAPTTADVDLSDPESPSMAMEMELEGETTRTIMVDGDVYLNMGESTSGKYLSLAEAAQSDNPMSELFTAMGEMTGGSLDDMDPAAQLEGMGGAIKSFEKTGTETVDGVETDVYTIVLDVTKMDGPQVEDVPQEMLEQFGDMEMTYNVGEDNLARKAVITTGPKDEEVVITSVFSEWGEPLDIAVPAGDELITLDELTEGMLG